MTISFSKPEMAGELERCDARLLAVILAAAMWVRAGGKILQITCLLRSRARQEEIYRTAVELGRKEPPKSPHEDGRAADFSIRGLTEAEIAGLVDYLNTRFPYQGSSKYRTALRHDVGQGDHIHVQVSPALQSWGVM